MKQLSILIFYLVSISQVEAQVDSSQSKLSARPQGKKIRTSAWIIKWAPASLLTPETPTLQTGLEFIPRVKGHLGIEFDYGFKCIIGTNEWDDRFARRYDKSRLEMRYYLHPFQEKRIANYFIAIEGFHINYQYSTQNKSYIASDNIEYLYDFARTTKKVNGACIKAGYVFKFKFPIWVEGYFGIGVREVDIAYGDLINKRTENSFSWPVVVFPAYENNNEGHFSRFHVSLGVKVSYRL